MEEHRKASGWVSWQPASTHNYTVIVLSTYRVEITQCIDNLQCHLGSENANIRRMMGIFIVEVILLLNQVAVTISQQYTHQITLQILPNGTLVQVAGAPISPTYTLSTKVIAGLFLFLIFLISFTGNVIIISTIGSSLTLKRIPHNIVLLQLGVCGLVEVILNMGLCTGYLLTQPWRLGR